MVSLRLSHAARSRVMLAVSLAAGFALGAAVVSAQAAADAPPVVAAAP